MAQTKSGKSLSSVSSVCLNCEIPHVSQNVHVHPLFVEVEEVEEQILASERGQGLPSSEREEGSTSQKTVSGEKAYAS